jgi:hypothetical protein
MAEVIRALVAILRYVAAPVVALLVVWLYDEKHDAPSLAARLLPRSPDLSLTWEVTAILVAAGLVVYYAHRTLIHPAVSCVMMKILSAWRKYLSKKRRQASNDLPSNDDLHFARWLRRGALQGSSECSVQSVLDESNAASHFFYCSAWCSIGASLVMNSLAPGQLHLGPWFYIAVAAMLMIGVVCDWRMMLFDIEAYRRFAMTRAGLPSSQLQLARPAQAMEPRS